MNKAFFWISTSLIALVAIGVGVALHESVVARISRILVEDVVASKTAQLRQIASIVRNDLVLGNIRGARVTLEELRSDGVFAAYSIHAADGGQEKSDGFDAAAARSATRTIVIPVAFGTGGAASDRPWGNLVFMIEPERAIGSRSSITAVVAGAMALAAALFSAVTTTLLWILYRTTSHLVPILEAEMRGGTDNAPIDRMTEGAWSPLLEAFAAASRRVAEWKAEVEEGRRHVAVARMTQMIAHDVRKPFSTLSIGLGMLDAVASDPQRTRQTIAKVRNRVQSARRRIEGLLADVLEASSRPEAVVAVPTRLEALIATALEDAFSDHAGAEVRFSYELSGLPPLMVDPVRMQRVITNIVENARQAMANRGTISFSTRLIPVSAMNGAARENVEVAIANSGSFVSLETREAIFDAFYTRGKAGGTGLGLAIAKKIITAHGGTIRCESDVATGTSFVFTLPLSHHLTASHLPRPDLPADAKDLARVLEQASQ
jgi:signal transduction histidine kinase